ncbi:MAG: hypothetical protein NTY47_03740, partial [Candidatus Omnitrophica bacterium]|nr:hypothetical protein [Candidatus Omnitrophota bacterium]
MIRQNRSQVIIITLWIMIILSLLAISVANRVSLGLRLSKYARDAVKADALAIAGLNRAAKEISGETNQFSVVYYQADPNGKLSPVYGVCDEDRKININAADEGLLRVLLEEFNANHPEKLAKNILAWRGDPNIPADDPSRDYSL